jgi:hypothetical protein
LPKYLMRPVHRPLINFPSSGDVIGDDSSYRVSNGNSEVQIVLILPIRYPDEMSGLRAQVHTKRSRFKLIIRQHSPFSLPTSIQSYPLLHIIALHSHPFPTLQSDLFQMTPFMPLNYITPNSDYLFRTNQAMP